MQVIWPAMLEGGGIAAPPDTDACENGLFWILPALNAAAATTSMRQTVTTISDILYTPH